MSTAQATAPAAAPADPSVVPDTIPKILLRNAANHGLLPAFREKALGIWQTWTWGQVHEEVRCLSVGLARLGLERGQTVAIIGDNRPHLYWTMAAAQCLGAIPVPVYQDSVALEMAFVLSHAEVSFAVVENQEQVDKVISIADKVPTLKTIVYLDPRGLHKYDTGKLHALEAVQKIGRDELKSNASVASAWLAEISRTNAAIASAPTSVSKKSGSWMARAIPRPAAKMGSPSA